YASLYAVLVIFLAPISLGPIQLRVADCLLPLVTLFGWPVILGATLGCFVGNIFGGIIVFGSFNLIDVVLGSTANFVASLAIFTLRRKRFLSCIVGSILIGVIVGGYLWLFFSPPDIFGLSIQPWIAMIISLTLSSLIAIAGIGYILLLALSQPNIIGPIRAKGLKVYL
ncbi:MAG: QueT transporter family protein, partial [Candidatus Bathyarchaeia archaeon]